MSFIKIKNLEEQLLKIKSFLPEYVNEKYNVDISSGKKIHCLSPLHDDSTPSMSMFRTSDNIPLLKCHSCIDQNELIWTNNGLVKMKNLSIGDLVLSLDGSYNPISMISSKKSNLYSIKTKSFRDGLLATNDHPFFVLKAEEAYNKLPYIGKNNNDYVFIKKLKFNKRNKNSHPNNHVQISELQLRDISQNDYLLFPKIKSELKNVPLQDVNFNIIKKYTRGKKVPRVHSLPLNLDMAWLYGIWVAEGSVCNRSVIFTLHIDEALTFGNKIKNILSDFGLTSKIILIPEKNTCRIECNNVDLCTHLSYWFGSGAANKTIPSQIYTWDLDLRTAFLRGYLDGDGSKTSKNIVASTISKKLAYSLYNLSIQCNLLPSLTFHPSYVDKNNLTHKDSWRILYRNKESLAGFYETIDGTEYYISQVLEVKAEDKESVVYDITVENNPSFVTKLGAVHNCGITLDIFNVCHITEHRPIVGPGFIDDTVVYLSKKYDIPIEMAKLSEDEIYEMNLINMYKAIHTYIISQDFSSDHINELKKRGWTAEFAKKIGIGCCYDISHLKDHLKNIGYSYKFMEENDLDHDRLFNPNNLIFTLFDEYGRPVSFSARNLTYDGLKDENGRLINGTKFLNSKVNPRCGVGKKSEILYMFHVARTKPSPSIVFEGNADAVTAHFNGITNAVAICGLSLNESHLNMFRRNGIYDIIVCLDGDEAGQNKAKQILDDALRKVHDIKIRFIFLPDKKIVDASGNTVLVKSDPDEYIREFGAESFLKLPKIDPFSWRLQQFDYDEARDSESICFAMIPIISADPSSIKREGMIRELSQYTGVSEKAIREEVNKIVNADDLKIAKAKKAILDELVNQLSAGEVAGIETFLNSAIDKIQDVEKQFKTSVLDTEARVADMLGIKAYQESEEGHTQFNFGNDYRSINIALNGDLKQKMMLVGGTANAGACFINLNMLFSYNNKNKELYSEKFNR